MTTPCFYPRSPIICLFIFALIIIGSAQRINAQITAAVYNGPGDFAYDVHSMSDLDQRRENLPNNGSMYCIPTACMNLCAFAANFGFPELGPGPGFWQGVPGHDDMTTYLFFMGAYMNTDPDDGTNGSGKIGGLTNWIEDYGQPLCIVSAYPDDTGYWPTIDRAAIHGASGAIVQMSYGRYEWQQVAGRPWLTDRNGGHGVTLKLCYADNGDELGPRLIHYRDPATDDGDLTSNSVFDSKWPMTAGNIEIGTNIYDGNMDYVVTSLLNPPPAHDDRLRIMDSYLALYPGGGLSYDDVEVNAMFVNGSLGFTNDIPSPFNVGQVQGNRVLATIPHPENHSSLVLVESSRNGVPQLYQSLHGGRFVLLTDLPMGANSLTLGPGHTVYCGLDRVQTEMVALTLRGYSLHSSRIIALPSDASGIDCLTYDEDSGLVVVANGRRIFMIDPETGDSSGFKTRGLGNDSHPIRSMTVHNHRIVAATTQGNVAQASLFPIVPDVLFFQTLSLPGVTDARAVDVDSYSRMYVSDHLEGLLEYTTEDGLNWNRAGNPYFDAAQMRGRRFAAFKNRVTIDPDDLRPAQWYNVDPNELESVGPDVPD